ncbi:ASCH domain-containing protein [Lacrimispora sp.]|uniref:ASCH domain-containing protein n=1 Tax=Lacrimispora sp. TaxID=2719234 RepID=UPI00289C0D37|nr:ASCH domain-containing protein [Lacrimispora sp.]
MSVKPILFNTDMVQAILDGRKRVTRRVVKPQPEAIYVHGKQRDIINRNEIAFKVMNRGGKDCYMIPPYQPGDILYVRETWQCINPYSDKEYVYRASCDADFASDIGKWIPSIHMPKEAARIWLKVIDVRVERLQDITDEQAELEGTHDYSSTANGFFYIWDSTIKKANLDRYGWDADPWVWVIEFERCEKPRR